jgi:hypothetical protein
MQGLKNSRIQEFKKAGGAEDEHDDEDEDDFKFRNLGLINSQRR